MKTQYVTADELVDTLASAREKPTRLLDSSMRNWLSRDISKSPENAQESISRRDTTDTLPRLSVSKP